MADTFQYVDIGSAPNAKDGDTARAAFRKVNANFKILYDAVANTLEEKDANFTAEAQHFYLIDTTISAVTATLPANPAVGTIIRFVDKAGRFAINPFNVAPNGQRIHGQTSSGRQYTENYTFVDYFYAGAITGWIVK